MDNKKWYMITTVSSREEKVIESLKNRVISEKLEDLFEDFKVMMVPHLSPKEIERKNNGEDYKVRSRSLFPGYIFIKMNMTNKSWFIVRNTQYVTGLVGSSGQRAQPTPISNFEMEKMEKRVEKMNKDFSQGIGTSLFKKGFLVEVIDGPTKGQIGPIIELNEEKQIAIVELVMFERKTPIEMKFKNLKIK